MPPRRRRVLVKRCRHWVVSSRTKRGLMDAIATLAFELQPAAPALAGAGSAGAANNASVFEVSHFNAAFAAAANNAPAPAHVMQVSSSESQGFRTVMATLENLNGRAESLGSKALEAQHGEFRPSA